MRRATSKPAEVIREATGREPTDIYGEAREAHSDLPDDIDDDDKAMLLMELGLRIMGADPQGGLIGALGQAGIGTIGSWRHVRDRRRAERLAQQDDELQQRRHYETLDSRERQAQATEAGRDRRHAETLQSQGADRASRERQAQGDTGPLVPIYDPQTGQTTYGTREQALGRATPPKGGLTVYDPQTGQPLVSTGGIPG